MKKKHNPNISYENTLSEKDKARIKKQVKISLEQAPKEILKTVLNSGTTPRKFLTKDEVNILDLPPIQKDKRAEFIEGLWEPFPPFENTFPPFSEPVKTMENIKEYVLSDMQNEELKRAMISQCEQIKCFLKIGKTGRAIGFAYLLGLNVMLEKFLRYNNQAYWGTRQENGRHIAGTASKGKGKIQQNPAIKEFMISNLVDRMKANNGNLPFDSHRRAREATLKEFRGMVSKDALKKSPFRLKDLSTEIKKRYKKMK